MSVNSRFICLKSSLRSLGFVFLVKMDPFHFYLSFCVLFILSLPLSHSWTPSRSHFGEYLGYSPYEFSLDSSMMTPQPSSHPSITGNFNMDSPSLSPASLSPGHPQQVMQPAHQPYAIPSVSPHPNVAPDYAHRNMFIDSIFPHTRGHSFPASFAIPRYPNSRLFPFASTINHNVSDCTCMPVHMCTGKPLDSMFNSPLDFHPITHPMQVYNNNYQTFNSEDRKKRYLALKNGPSADQVNSRADNNSEVRDIIIRKGLIKLISLISG